MMDLIKELEKASYTQPGISKKPVVDLDKAIELVKSWIIEAKVDVFHTSNEMWTIRDMRIIAESKLGQFWGRRYDESKLTTALNFAIDNGDIKDLSKIPYYLEKYCLKTN